MNAFLRHRIQELYTFKMCGFYWAILYMSPLRHWLRSTQTVFGAVTINQEQTRSASYRRPSPKSGDENWPLSWSSTAGWPLQPGAAFLTAVSITINHLNRELSCNNDIIRQADVVGRLKLYCCPFFFLSFFVNPLFSAVAQTTPVKSIPEVRT